MKSRDSYLVKLVGRILIALTITPTARANDMCLENQDVRLSMSEDGGFSFKQIEQRQSGQQLLAGKGEPLWRIEWRKEDGSTLAIQADAPAQRQGRITGDERAKQLELAWSGLELGDGTARVVVHGRLPRGSRLSYWTLEVQWTAAELVLRRINFPRVGGIARSSEHDMLTMPFMWGRYCRDPVRSLRRYSLGYPCKGSMQFWSFLSEGAGLYLATHDSQAWLKQWTWTADGRDRGRWQATHFVPVPTPQPRRYRVPYPAVIGVFQGDWHDAAAIYRAWAVEQPWCRAGKIAGRDSIPERFKAVALWLKYYYEPGKVLAELADHQQALRVPMSVHYYRYPISRFDDNYPEMMPARPGFLQGVRAMQAIGADVMPYTQGTIADLDTESWRRENLAAAAVRTEDGGLSAWPIHDETFARMCPGSERWRATVRDFARKMIWDYGANGIYLDVLSSGAALPCFDPKHGHPLNGSNSWGQGNRKLLESLREEIRNRRPEAFFTTEGCCEIYIDQIDGFLSLDVTRGGYRPPVMLLPLFSAVYHDYAIQYGSDCRLSQPPATFCALLAEHFVWGAKPTLSEMHPPPIAEKPESAAYLRETVQCYDQVARKFLLEGQWLRPPALDVPTETIKLTRKVRVDVPIPVVRHSLWRGADGSLGLVLTNWTAQPQRIRFELDPADYGLDGPVACRQLWPRQDKLVGTHLCEASAGPCRTVTPDPFFHDLPPRSVRLYEIVPADDSGTNKPPPGRRDVAYPFLVLRRDTEESTFPSARVEPGTLWHGGQSRLTLAADGELRVTDAGELDFVSLRRHPVTLDEPVPLTVESRPGGGLIVQVEAGTRLTLDNPAGCQIIARNASGTLDVARQDQQAIIEAGTAPVNVRFAGPLGGVPLVQDTWRYDRKGLAARSQSLAKQWRTQQRGGANLDELSSLAREQARLTAAVEGLLGVRLEVDLAATARALPLEPLPFAVTVQNDTAQCIKCGPCEIGVTGDRHRDAVRLDTEGNGAKTIAPGAATTVSRCRLLVTDRDWAEHAVNMRATLSLAMSDQRFILTREATVPVDMPLLAELVERQRTMVAGRRTQIALRVRNVAPRSVATSVRCSPPPGWKVEPPQRSVTIAAAGKEPNAHLFEFAVTAPETVQHGAVKVLLETFHEGHPESRVVDVPRCEVLPGLRPLLEEGAFEPAEESPRLRHAGRAAIHLKRGETARMVVHNLGVAHYGDSLAWRIRGPHWQQINTGKIAKDQSKTLEIEAEEPGTFFIELEPGRNSCTLTTNHRAFAWEAGPTCPLRVLHQNPPLWFYVPAEARRFDLVVDCEGEGEPVDVELRDPDGQIVVDADGALLDRRFEIDVAPSGRGRLWQLHVRPTGDASFSIEGDAAAYLSDHPARVLRPVIGETKPVEIRKEPR